MDKVSASQVINFRVLCRSLTASGGVASSIVIDVRRLDKSFNVISSTRMLNWPRTNT